VGMNIKGLDKGNMPRTGELPPAHSLDQRVLLCHLLSSACPINYCRLPSALRISSAGAGAAAGLPS
jgi:hypothetical protein